MRKVRIGPLIVFSASAIGALYLARHAINAAVSAVASAAGE